MRSRQQRITNGQRAAVCGLVLAGIGISRACAIVAAPYKRMHDLLPCDWTAKKMPVRKWKADRLEALRRAYSDRSLPVRTVARLFKTDPGIVRLLARRHGWLRRKPGNHTCRMPRDHRALVRKLQQIVGPDLAVTI